MLFENYGGRSAAAGAATSNGDEDHRPAPPPATKSVSPEKPVNGPLAALKQLVATADADQAQALATELKALVKQCEQRIVDARKAASSQNLGEVRWAADATCLQPRGKATLRVGDHAIVVVNPKDGAVKGEFPLFHQSCFYAAANRKVAALGSGDITLAASVTAREACYQNHVQAHAGRLQEGVAGVDGERQALEEHAVPRDEHDPSQLSGAPRLLSEGRK